MQGPGAARSDALPLVPGPRHQEREGRAGGRSHLGVRQWPPMAMLEDGSCARLQGTTVQSCFQARGFRCLVTAKPKRAGYRYCGDLRLRPQCPLGRVGTEDSARPAPIHRPEGLKGSRQNRPGECRALGEGVEFVSGSCMDLRELAAFAALFLSHDGDVPFSAEVSRAAA